MSSRGRRVVPKVSSSRRIRDEGTVGYGGDIEVLRRFIRRPRLVPSIVVDGALAVLLFLLVEASADPIQRIAPLSVAIVLFETVPLAFRRRAPASVLLLVAVALLAHLLIGFHNSFFDTFAGAVALYSVAAYRTRSISVVFLGLLPLALGIALVVDWHNRGEVSLIDVPYNLLLFVTAWVLGDALQTRRAYALQLEERERILTRERQERAKAALAEERARIARELHDIVAHSVSVMVLQANAGERIASSRPEQAVEHLAAIQTIGRQALAELRRLLGVLRGGGDSDDAREPQPRLADVEKLVEQARRSGLDAAIRVEGDGDSLPEAVQLQAYRVVQEALTNTLRHAGASRALVTIRCSPRDLELEVIDDGRSSAQPAVEARAGLGLIGMRERVHLYGGELETGPRPEGGFRVHARFSLDGRP